MDREEIIRMAREAGAMFDHMTWVERDLAPVFERFAALVAAAERAEVERLKLLCEEMLRELYVYRASEYLRDVTAAIRARSKQ